jgi:hypothetical protein
VVVLAGPRAEGRERLEDAQGLYTIMTDKPPGVTRCSFEFLETDGRERVQITDLGWTREVFKPPGRRRCVECCGSLRSMEYCSVI